MDKLKEIEERVAKATKGSWHGFENNPCDEYWASQHPEDADFIAHAREDIPYLLTLLRERDAENTRLWENIRMHWKEHARCRAEIETLNLRIRDREQSIAYWKSRAEWAEEEIVRLKAEMQRREDYLDSIVV